MVARYNERLAHTRRQLIKQFGAAAGALVAVPLVGDEALAQVAFSDDPFQLGVAAGDPAATSLVIWTRLAPKPFDIGFGMTTRPVEVEWEVARDDGFRAIAASGKAVATPHLGHSVHVEVNGLAPSRPYWYRFRAGGAQSPVGRARTTPALGAMPQQIRFAIAGCQNYEAGLFSAYRHLVEEDPDFVFCYGDYIYENGGSPAGPNVPAALVSRRHLPGEIFSVDDYRRRYAQYKSDPNLRAAHAAAAWFPVWDDHETDNNWASEWDEGGNAAELFRFRRQAAVQAYYEHMPFRRVSMPYGSSMQLYRRATFGGLMEFNLLDTRQYRSNQPCNDQGQGCTDLSSAAHFLGDSQEAWLRQGLSTSKARWNVLAQQVVMMDLDRDPGAAYRANIDSWAGYRGPRERVLRHIADAKIPNVVVLTGDEHVNYAGEVHLDSRSPVARGLAVEFTSTSITSGGDGADLSDNDKALLSANPTLKFVNRQRGYMLCDVSKDRWETKVRILDKVSAPDGKISTRARLAVAAGSNQVTAA
jgi:alkaline phosphatase D